MYIYFTYLGGNTVALEERRRDHNTQHQKLWILQDHEQQAATHEQDNPGKGGAKERGPPQLLWRSRAPQLDHHNSLSSLFSHTVTHVDAPR
jgi:hypothetical protein